MTLNESIRPFKPEQLLTESEIISRWNGWRLGDPVKVSIICITFNHEKYIEDAICGFLAQTTDFPFEIVIHDDASSDSSSRIILQYAKQYPSIIRPVFQVVNQWSNGIHPWFDNTFPMARGELIALCEGDDYWFDDSKLQSQVNFLDAHSDYSLIVGGFQTVNEAETETKQVIKLVRPVENNGLGYTFQIEDMKRGWITKTLTAVFRRSCCEIPFPYKYGRDVHLFYHVMSGRKGYYLNRVLGAYRVHIGGIHSMIKKKDALEIGYKVYTELYRYNRDSFCREKKLNVLLAILNHRLFGKDHDNCGPPTWKAFSEACLLVRSPWNLLLIIKALSHPSLNAKVKELFFDIKRVLYSGYRAKISRGR